MPRLTIGDKSVTVDDSFLKLSPDEQNAAVADIAKSIGVSAGPAAAPAAPAEPAVEPITTNKVVRAAATGIPIVGGLVNKLDAATNATLAPVVEPLMAPSPQDISRPGPSTESIGNVPLPGKTPGWKERYAKSLAMQEGMDKTFAEQRPVVDTVAKVAGGVGGSLPMMMAAPAAFGLTGPLPQMVMRGAASNAALGAADAVVRGEDIAAPAAIGGAVGAAAPLVARGVGKVVQSVKDMRNPPVAVPQNVEKVAGVDVPLTTGQAMADPAAQAEEEIIRRGARGGSAEAIARQADEEAKKALADATEGISRSLDPRSVPAAADSNPVPPQFRAGTKDDTGPWFLGSDKPLYANASRDSLDRLYGPEVAAAFDKFPSVSGVNAKGQPITVWHKPGEEARALREIENFKMKGTVPSDSAEAARLHYESGLNLGYPEPAARGYVEKRFGAGVLGEPSARTAPQAAGEVVQSELAAQEAARRAAQAAQVSQVAAQGDALARNLGGGAAPVSSVFDAAESTGAAVAARRDAALAARKAAYEARDAVPGTFDESVPRAMAEDIRTRLNTGDNALWVDPTNESTANKALKLIDQTLGRDTGLLENAVRPKAPVAPAPAAAAAPVKAAEDETVAALRAKFGDSVADAYAKQNPTPVMTQLDDGLTSIKGVDWRNPIPTEALPSPAGSPIGDAVAAAPAASNTVDLRTMDEARKRLVTMFGDAKSKAISSGDKSDMRAMGKILNEFDNVIADALASGKFTGDAKLAADLQSAARKSHAEYRQTFSSRGPGDEIGRKVEKILGRYSDTAATAEEIAVMSYGPKSAPGTGASVKVGLRLKNILGENSPEYAKWKQGAFAHVDDETLSPAKRAGRIDNFLNTSWAKAILKPDERASMTAYSRSLRGIEPGAKGADDLSKALARITGADGHVPATPGQVADMLYSQAGTKTAKGTSVHLAAHLQKTLKPESWVAVRQGMWEKLTNAGEGKVPFEAQALSQRLHEFLNESGSGLAKVMFTKAEREEMAKLAAVYQKMIPAKGTTNPSGSATIGARIATKALDNLGAMLGFGAGGIPGAVAGHVAQKAGSAIKEARAARDATRLFFGAQPKRAVQSSRLPVLLAPAVPASQR